VTTATTLSPDSVLDALRGDRASRPPRDTVSAARWRAELEIGVLDVLGEHAADPPLIVSTSSLRSPGPVTDLADATRARLRGALVSVLARLLSVGAPVGDAFDDALAAWRAERPAPELLEHLASLDADACARLATDVTAHHVTVSRALGGWPVRTAQRASLRLGAGRVIVRDTVDLVIGAREDEHASVVLVDLTTAPLGEAAERALRFHALVETLRSGEVALRSAVLSSATGELWLRDVDDEMLSRAAGDVLGAVHEQWRAR
jgi:hypothetical protein